jgi:hypothetical protein
MKFEDGDYHASKACGLENGFPVSLNFSEDSKKLVIGTNLRKLLVLDPETEMLQYKSEDLSSCFWSTWLSRFPTITKDVQRAPMMPITIGNSSNLVVAGDEHGNIHLWREVESIKENIGANLSTHASNVQKLEMTVDDQRVLSTGYLDQAMCQFKIKPLFSKQLTAGTGAG